MMQTLVHGGFRSHDRGSCSMHVNIGVGAFSDAAHLARFMRLVTTNPRWTTRMSQRTHEQVATWARFDEYRTDDDCQRVAREVMSYGYAYSSHSSVLNVSHGGRIEFRCPRGTLRADRFYAKLEWVASMIEYARSAASVGHANPSDYVKWVADRRSEWPEVYAYIAELTPGRVA
jgi:hypothetical protein